MSVCERQLLHSTDQAIFAAPHEHQAALAIFTGLGLILLVRAIAVVSFQPAPLAAPAPLLRPPIRPFA
jgi:hypothetical protein